MPNGNPFLQHRCLCRWINMRITLRTHLYSHLLWCVSMGKPSRINGDINGKLTSEEYLKESKIEGKRELLMGKWPATNAQTSLTQGFTNGKSTRYHCRDYLSTPVINGKTTLKGIFKAILI